MNKRIRELAEQAGFGEQWFEEHPTGCSLPKPLMLKEYTELIVRECHSIIEAQKESLCDDENAWSDRDFGYFEAITDIGDMIKQHLGVEE